jgi:hypothetical protein
MYSTYVGMYVCTYVCCVCVGTYVCMYVPCYAYVLCIYVGMHVCTYIVCACARMYVKYVCMRVCINACTCVCTYEFVCVGVLKCRSQWPRGLRRRT